MLNVMIIEGYVRNDPEFIGNENFKGIKFQMATINKAMKKKQNKYMWVNVVCFGSDKKLQFIKDTIEKDDYITVRGSYSYTPVGNKYFPQLIAEDIDKKFAKGSVPEKETVSLNDTVKEEAGDEELAW